MILNLFIGIAVLVAFVQNT